MKFIKICSTLKCFWGRVGSLSNVFLQCSHVISVCWFCPYHVPWATSLPWNSCWWSAVWIEIPREEAVTLALHLHAPGVPSWWLSPGDVQARWLGWEPQTRLGFGLAPGPFWVLHGPGGLSRVSPPPCCLTPVFLMVSVPLLCSFPPEGTSSSVCRAQRRGGLPESLPANITVGVLPWLLLAFLCGSCRCLLYSSWFMVSSCIGLSSCIVLFSC